ncbi:sugar transferase [Bythopirellula goksoeyrii]|uniref:Undecaprenyl phosphate N,N'-diacetylbacillosamine 1-phosphate transferase n=1 Tax=Bythopirellula goksoeyrii TaxID=1400387 RepID=A0A5B9QG81_9BACT|nr:sugar transferase [Bythopirellula goksoeyrii]QEG36645.1 Undecaprenyl phosphate N,N'-diacetylbacillosamine 1-phosphate transferase [Bythopirellula goksoeyrii]
MPLPSSIYRDYFKPLFDRCVAALGLLIVSPVLIVIAVLVRYKLGSPVIFVQTRSGKKGHPFNIYKFRTMNDATDTAGQLLSDAERLTPFGQFLRSTSLDELPELWNVLSGDMSLVGPRPLLMEYLSLYSIEQARRHDVRPGITGWAQVRGRNKTSWEERFTLDVWYVRNQSLWLDWKILVLTILAVLMRRDVSADGHETMPRFNVPRYTNTYYDRSA